jgi:hypothetical protein
MSETHLALWSTAEQRTGQSWDGRVLCGGFVARLHALQIADTPLIVAEIVGGVFPQGYTNLPSLESMQYGVGGARPPHAEPVGREMIFPFILDPDSHFAALAQDSLVAGIAVDAVGRLAPEAQGLHRICGLPLLAEAITLIR